MTSLVMDKKADLAGPGIGDYLELEKILPTDYHSLLSKKETQQAIFRLKRYIEDNLCQELNLMMVQVPLIVDSASGVNDMLDRDGSRPSSSRAASSRSSRSTRRWPPARAAWPRKPAARKSRPAVVQLRMRQRLTAGDADHGRAKPSQRVDAAIHLFERHRL